MISAGQNARGIGTYGAQPRQPQTKEEIEKQRKEAREKLDKKLKKRIAEYKKENPLFQKNLCPFKYSIVGNLFEFGELCRDAKDKLDRLLPHKPKASITAAIGKNKLPEIPKKELLTYFQLYYMTRYFNKFKTRQDVEKLLKKLKKSPRSQRLQKAYNIKFWNFLDNYIPWIRSKLKKEFVMLNDKIYKKPGNIKVVKTKGTSGTEATTDVGMQCFDRTGRGNLTLYEDCSCAVSGGGTECEWLQEDSFKTRTRKPGKGTTRALIYYNPTSAKLRLIPEKDALPEGYKKISFEIMKYFLSRHTDAKKDPKDGGKKLLLDFLKMQDTTGIFKNEDGHFAVDVGNSKFLAYFNMDKGKIDRRPVVRNGVAQRPDEALALITFINKNPSCRISEHKDPLRIDNMRIRESKSQNGITTLEFHYPVNPLILTRIEKLIRKHYHKHGDTHFSSIKGVSGYTLFTMLKYMNEHWLRSRKMQDKQDARADKGVKDAKAHRDKVEFRQALFFGLQLFSSLALQTLSLGVMAFIWKPELKVKFTKWLAEKTFSTRKWTWKGRQVLFQNRPVKLIRRYPLFFLPFIRWSFDDKKDVKAAAKTQALKVEEPQIQRARLEREQLASQPEWKRNLGELCEKGGERVEQALNKLLTNPDRFITGLEKESWLYIQYLNRKSMGHPSPYGPSGAGKDMVAKRFEQIVAMDDLHVNKHALLKKALQKLYKGLPEAEAKTKVKEKLAEYAKVSKKLRRYYKGVVGMQSYRLSRSAMNAKVKGTASIFGGMLRTFENAQANHVNIIIPELPDWMRAGEYGSGSGEDRTTNKSEQFGAGLKTNLEQANSHYSPDTTPDRIFKIMQDPEFKDFYRRLMKTGVYIRYRSPAEVRDTIAPSRFVLGPLEDDYKVKWSTEAIEYNTRLTTHLMLKPKPEFAGQSPLDSTLGTMKDISEYVNHQAMEARERAKKAGDAPEWDGKSLIEITGEHVVEYFRAKNHNIPRGQESTLGLEVFTRSGEDYTNPEELRAVRALSAGTEGDARIPVEAQLLFKHRGKFDRPIIYQIALEIDADRLGGKNDDPKTAMLAHRVARRALALAEHKGITLESSEDIQKFLYGDKETKTEGYLEDIVPLKEDQMKKAKTTLEQDIMRAMNPSKYKNRKTMYRVARVLAQEVEMKAAEMRTQGGGAHGLPYMPNFMDDAQLNETLEPVIERYVEDFDSKRKHDSEHVPGNPPPIDPSRGPGGSGGKGSAYISTMLARRSFNPQSVEVYIATRFMNADNFSSDREIVDVAEKAADRIITQLHASGSELTPSEIDKLAEIAINEATLEVRGPSDDPDPKDPKGPKPGAKPGPKPGPKPAATDGAEPKPATESKMSLAEITEVLPRSQKKYAHIVKAVMDRSPAIYNRNEAGRRALIISIAENAHKRRLGATSRPVGHQAAVQKSQKANDVERARRQRALREHDRRIRIINRQKRLRKGVLPL